ncbi:MAG: LysM peptidoglycan-binding domain-containing protein [Anaerolineales bacterium]|nr:LysM peptidoglycan-binding domain-containing protein [Anaerolineales bacterium]
MVVLCLAAGLLSTRVAWADQIVHIVQPGENLFRIGLRYGVGWQSLMAANGLASTQIYVGQALVIPSPGSPTAALTAAVPSAAVPAPLPAAPSGTYIVQPGDTLWRIAQRHRLTLSGLMAANGLVEPNRIFSGQTLLIPGAAPAAAKLLSVTGQPQAWPLDCEARSAVDWAAYFGTVIDEADFVSRLPLSDDPDLGFVGDVRGRPGQLPPESYGVHAGPLAALLQAYGLSARAARGLTWDAVRAEIDANRPVIVWVIGQSWPGAAVDYAVPSSGRVTRVAAFEHTALVIGYNGEFVSLLDGATVYQASLARFMASWGVLGNMAVLSEQAY